MLTTETVLKMDFLFDEKLSCNNLEIGNAKNKYVNNDNNENIKIEV